MRYPRKLPAPASCTCFEHPTSDPLPSNPATDFHHKWPNLTILCEPWPLLKNTQTGMHTQDRHSFLPNWNAQDCPEFQGFGWLPLGRHSAPQAGADDPAVLAGLLRAPALPKPAPGCAAVPGAGGRGWFSTG